MVDRSPHEIRRMFGSIAHRYDFLNRLLSLSVDRMWRRFLRRKLEPFLEPSSLILDVCTGTGDVAIELSRVAPVLGCDFCHPMLVLGAGKVHRLRDRFPVVFVEADALNLPFGGCRFDAVTIAFGLRNLERYAQGLEEMERVLSPGGVLAILEFSEPVWPVFKQIYGFYFRYILPRIGRLVSGKDGPYSYLPESVRQFPDPTQLEEMLRQAGFEKAWFYRLSGGIAALHLARKPRRTDTPT